MAMNAENFGRIVDLFLIKWSGEEAYDCGAIEAITGDYVGDFVRNQMDAMTPRGVAEILWDKYGYVEEGDDE